MGYKLRLINTVLIWDDEKKNYTKREASTEFDFATSVGVSNLVREMAAYSSEPLTFEITKED